jgi:hypothetical protein
VSEDEATNGKGEDDGGPSIDVGNGSQSLANSPLGKCLESALEASEDIRRRSHCERVKVGEERKKGAKFFELRWSLRSRLWAGFFRERSKHLPWLRYSVLPAGATRKA